MSLIDFDLQSNRKDKYVLLCRKFKAVFMSLLPDVWLCPYKNGALNYELVVS